MNPVQIESRTCVGKGGRDVRKKFAPLMASDPRLYLSLWGWHDECGMVWVLAASEKEAEAIAAAFIGGKPERLMTLQEEQALTSENRTSCRDCGAIIDHVAAITGGIDSDSRGLLYGYDLRCPECRRKWHFVYRLAEVDSVKEVTYV